MKTMRLFAACVCFALTLPGFAQENYLANPDFTKGGAAPEGWSLSKNSSPNVRIVRDTKTFLTAPAALRLDLAGGAASGVAVAGMDTLPDGPFTLQFASKTGGKIASLKVDLQVFNADWSRQLAWITSADNDSHTLRPSADWQTYSRRIELPEGARHAVFYFTAQGEDGGKAWLDAVRLITPDKPDYNPAADRKPIADSAPVKVIGQEDYRWGQAIMGGVEYATGVVVDEKHPQRLFTRCDTGGFFQWDCGGKTWVAKMDSIPWNWSQLFSVESFAVDCNNPNVFYADTGGGRWGSLFDVLKTTDGGKTWQRTHLTRPDGKPVFSDTGGDDKPAGERIVCDPNDSNILWFGTRSDGLFRSGDGAKTWAQAGSFPARGSVRNGITFVTLDWRRGKNGQPTQTIYAGVHAGKASDEPNAPNVEGGVYRSQDGGKTWQFLAGGSDRKSSPFKGRIGPDGSLYVSFVGGAGVWKFAQNQWRDITPAQAKGRPFAGITAHPIDPNVLMCACTYDNGEIYYTKNGGKTWTEYRFAQGNKPTGSIIIDYEPVWQISDDMKFGGYNADIFIDPTDPKTAYHCSFEGVMVTHNVGESALHFSHLGAGREQITMGDVVSPSAGAPAISGIWDMGGFRHEALDKIPARIIPLEARSGKGNWGEKVYQDVFQMDIQPKNPNNLVVAGGWQWNSTGDAAYSDDNGRTLHEFPSKPFPDAKFGRIAIGLDPSNVVWAPMGSSDTPVYFTKDKGKTWTAGAGCPLGTIATNGPWSFYKELVADRVKSGWFYLYDRRDGRFYRSENGGASWRHVSTLPKQSGAHFDTNQTRTAPGIGGAVWVSIAEKGLFQSGDGGETWTKMAGIQWSQQIGFGAGKPGGRFPAAYCFGQIGGEPPASEKDARAAMHRSDDMGRTWTRINDDLHGLAGIGAIAGDGQVWGRVYACSGGRGLWYGEPKLNAQRAALR